MAKPRNDIGEITQKKLQKRSITQVNDYPDTDRLRTVSDNSHPTDVVNLMFKGPTFPLPTIAVHLKGQTFKNI